MTTPSRFCTVTTLAVRRLLTGSRCTLIVILVIVIFVLISLLMPIIIATFMLICAVGLGVVVPTKSN